ncbi:hypothetical protein AB1Y20_017126 [Prymnesium parvum]|uniref:Dynein assembly factor 1, axonemal homolog n=1 Tax=Prymnesium parvum TaxID=97485 RepID=A0AB34I8S5_PRYPA|mmetsp:Transcript_39030/g.89678  ORF Transcript_39030/g.89678 Transcript_39030/m.89678 type:complete len:465 (-) Transcript_39030:288-1682(-)
MGAMRQRSAELEEDDELCSREKRITPRVLRQLVKEQQLYSTSSLNDKLYLHYRGFARIEGLDEWTGLRALWLEGNGFGEIEGLESLAGLRCLYLQHNCLRKIDNLHHCPLLATLQLSNNMLPRIENLSCLRGLSTLQIANNNLTCADDLRHLLECPSITVLDVQNNRIDEPEVIEIFESMPQLAVLQCQGNPFIPKVTSYRKTMVSRCKTLSYLDDRPIFNEERMATEAWVVGGLPAEREERRRQREEKDMAHRRNLQYMMEITRKGREAKEKADAERAARIAAGEEEAPKAVAKPASEAKDEPSEKEIYDRALRALEAKKRQMIEKKKQQDAAATLSAAETPSPLAEKVEAEVEVEEEEKKEDSRKEEDVMEGEEQDFEAAATFCGARPGRVFKLGRKGVGYYLDAAAGVDAAAGEAEGGIPPLTSARSLLAAPKFAGKSAEEVVEQVSGAAAPAAENLDELD